MDWGSVADWVSGVGGVLSVGATGYIAIHQTRRADRMEVQQEHLQFERRRAVVAQCHGLAKNLHDDIADYVRRNDENPINNPKVGTRLREDGERVADYLKRLKDHPSVDPDLFIVISKLADACTPPHSTVPRSSLRPDKAKEMLEILAPSVKEIARFSQS